jgi:V8-like Glu-specific endopeptidase
VVRKPAGLQRAGLQRAGLQRAGLLSAGLALALAVLVAALWQTVPPAMATSTWFGGTPAVGALFPVSDGRLGSHFCTASVVASPYGDVLVTAAHCVQGYSVSVPKGLAFVPGYDNGSAPDGVWLVTRIFVDQAWTSAADADDDVAFLTVAHRNGMAIESVTGAETLGTGLPASGVLHVIGYPEGAGEPITCQNRVSSFSPTQLQFDCRGYTDGTSGSPFLADVNQATGEGTVIGVIGGYQQGGDTPDISYAATLGSSVQALYDQAVQPIAVQPTAVQPTAVQPTAVAAR